MHTEGVCYEMLLYALSCYCTIDKHHQMQLHIDTAQKVIVILVFGSRHTTL